MTLQMWYHSLPSVQESHEFLKGTGYYEALALDPAVRFYNGDTMLPMDEGFLKFIESCGNLLSKDFFVIPNIDPKTKAVYGLFLKGSEKPVFKYTRKGYSYYRPMPKVQTNAICIVEGIKDIYIPRLCGLDSVALLGTFVDQALVDLMAHKRVYAFFDNDDAGDKAFWRLKKSLGDIKVIRGKYPKGFKDFGDLFLSESSALTLLNHFKSQLGV